MSLKPETKQRLSKYITDHGHTIHNDGADLYTGSWTIECGKCTLWGYNFRVSNLLMIMRNEEDIVCKGCKLQLKKDKFTAKNDFTHRAVIFRGAMSDRLTCNHCQSVYGYTGNFFDGFRCYCQLKIKQDEGIVYRMLREAFPYAVLYREQPIYNSHKADILVKLPRKNIYIEIDDHNHFNKPAVKQTDIESTNALIEQFDGDTFLIRIPTTVLKSPSWGNHLTTLVNNIEAEVLMEPVILFNTQTKDYYEYLNIPLDACRKILCRM